MLKSQINRAREVLTGRRGEVALEHRAEVGSSSRQDLREEFITRPLPRILQT